MSTTQRIFTAMDNLNKGLVMHQDMIVFLKRLSALAYEVYKEKATEDQFLEMVSSPPSLVGLKVSKSKEQMAVVSDTLESDWSETDGNEEYIEFDMLSMYLADASDHMNIAIEFEAGASKQKIQEMLWDMDTAAREQAADNVWSYGLGDSA